MWPARIGLIALVASKTRPKRPKRRPRWSKRVQEGFQTVPERSKTASFGPETVREAHRRLKMAPREKVWNQDFRKV